MQAECVANNHNCKHFIYLCLSILEHSAKVLLNSEAKVQNLLELFITAFSYCLVHVTKNPAVNSPILTFYNFSCRRQILELVLVATHIPKESWPTSLILCSAKTLDRRGRQGPHQIRSQGQMMIVSHSIKKRDVQHCY